MSGIRIVAVPHQLESIIEEFVVHGVHTNRVIIGQEADLLTEEELEDIRSVCEHRQIKLDFVPQLIGLGELPPAPIETSPQAQKVFVPGFELPRYFKFRPFFDFFAALAMILIFCPLLLSAAVLVLLDVGSPVLFWQQRIGQGGRRFTLQKFRTLRAPFDHRATAAPDTHRRTAAIVERAGRRYGLDRSATAPAGGPAYKSCHPTHGSTRYYGLGSGQRWQVSDAARKGPVRRILHPKCLPVVRLAHYLHDTEGSAPIHASL
jgi:hypothetical protein